MSTENTMGLGDQPCLGERLYTTFKKHDNAIAHIYVQTDRTETYSELLKKSIRVGLHLRDLGVTREDIIGACLLNKVNCTVPMIASQLMGFKIATMDPSFSIDHMAYLLNVIKPKILFVFESLLEKFEEALKKNDMTCKIIVIGNTDKYIPFIDVLKLHPEEDLFKPPKVNPKDTALMLFTSGTTGFPKAVALNHYSFLQKDPMGEIDSKAGIMERTKYISYISLYWFSETLLYFFCWHNGFIRVALEKFDANLWLNAVKKYKIDAAFMGPSQLNDLVLLEQKLQLDMSRLKYICLSGAGAKGNLLQVAFDTFKSTAILHSYGQTESGGIVMGFYARPEDIMLQKQKPLSTGRPLPEVQCKIVDPETEEVLGPYQKGELRYKTSTIMNGYYNMDSKEYFDKDGFFKSGDIAYFDEDNCFYIVGRIKEVFKYKGWHIIPAVIENILDSHPDVKESAVVGIPAENHGECPVGIVVLKDGSQSSAEDIKKFVDDQLSDNQKLEEIGRAHV